MLPNNVTISQVNCFSGKYVDIALTSKEIASKSIYWKTSINIKVKMGVYNVLFRKIIDELTESDINELIFALEKLPTMARSSTDIPVTTGDLFIVKQHIHDILYSLGRFDKHLVRLEKIFVQ